MVVRHELLHGVLQPPGAVHRGVDLRYDEDPRISECVVARSALAPVEPDAVKGDADGESIFIALPQASSDFMLEPNASTSQWRGP